MSRNIYDNWERLVAAVLKKEEIWQLFHEQSKSTSINTSISSDFSGQTPSEFANNRLNPLHLPSTPLTLSRANEDTVVHLGQGMRFSLRQLQVATDNFNSKNVVRKVGYGKIYTGKLGDGCLVEVVRVKLEEYGEDDEEQQFQREVEIGSLAAHRNLLHLHGFCRTSMERLLVYPFMANGSVAACLRERANSQPPLDWRTRKRIALGSARGLVYLHEHCDPKIIHCGIKAANIFLDEEFHVFVGNFSRAKVVKYKETMADTCPEYLSSVDCPEKIDVFSYGVLLLELITGLEDSELAQLANDRNVSLLDWVKGLLRDKNMETLVDTSLQGNYAEDEVEKLTQIALICTHRSPHKRPKMSEILRMLEGDLLARKWKKKLHTEDMFLQ